MKAQLAVETEAQVALRPQAGVQAAQFFHQFTAAYIGFWNQVEPTELSVLAAGEPPALRL